MLTLTTVVARTLSTPRGSLTILGHTRLVPPLPLSTHLIINLPTWFIMNLPTLLTINLLMLLILNQCMLVTTTHHTLLPTSQSTLPRLVTRTLLDITRDLVIISTLTSLQVGQILILIVL